MTKVKQNTLPMNDQNQQIIQEVIQLAKGFFDPMTIRSYFYSQESKHVDSIYQPFVKQIESWVSALDLYQSTEKIVTFFASLSEDYQHAFVLKSIAFMAELKLAYYERDAIQSAPQLAHLLYIPVLNRLSIQELKWKMEDFTMRLEFPQEYLALKSKLKLKRADREQKIDNFLHLLKKMDKNAQQYLSINGRVKHIRGIHEKMQRRKRPHDQIFDQLAVRIIVDNLKDCYWWLAEIHHRWEIITDEFDDYIKNPKPNGYQSLHTAIKDEQGIIYEIQIRTQDMDRAANYGVAAHWQYKQHQKDGGKHKKTKVDYVHAITPKGTIVSLPKGATGLDFAYRIHSEVGQHCQHVLVNGTIKKRSYVIKNGDCIEIVTDKNVQPNWDWLKPKSPMVRTKSAVRKISLFLRKELGISESEKPKTTLRLPVPIESAPNKSRRASNTIQIENEKTVVHRLAQCCKPNPGDECIGYMSLKRGLMIHRHDCQSKPVWKEELKNRFLNVAWSSYE